METPARGLKEEWIEAIDCPIRGDVAGEMHKSNPD
jgi:hypothetical protein